MSSPNILSPAGAKKLAEQIREIGKRARSEEDVRLNVEHVLRPVLEKLGITTQAAYEQPLTLLQGTGRADAVYGFGIIEYERPGKLATLAGRKEVVEQLSSYLVGKARELAPTRPVDAVKKMLGIGIDGEQVMYPTALFSASVVHTNFPASHVSPALCSRNPRELRAEH